MFHQWRYQLIILTLVLSSLPMLTGTHKRIDINQATRPQLESVPGIGPSMASRIIIERNRRGGFRSMNDLLKIRGIGRKMLIRFEKHLCVSKPGSKPEVETPIPASANTYQPQTFIQGDNDD